jgi:hypothetical protein
MGGLARWSIRIPVPDRFMKHVKKTTELLVGLGLKRFVSEIGLAPWQQRHASLVEVFRLQDCHRPEAIEGTDFVGRLGTQMAEASEIDAERQCFVHLRFTDYANFFVRGRPVELPAKWYLAQMEELRICYPGLHFRVYSDDLVRARLEIPLSTDTFFQELGSNETLVEMAQCQMGVLSASTFSWWGATVSFQFGLCQWEELAPLRPVGELVASASSASRQLLATRKQLQSIGVDIGRFASLHIRLGDYERFDVYGTTPVPPVSWYSSAISELRAVEPEIPIVVFSD